MVIFWNIPISQTSKGGKVAYDIKKRTGEVLCVYREIYFQASHTVHEEYGQVTSKGQKTWDTYRKWVFKGIFWQLRHYCAKRCDFRLENVRNRTRPLQKESRFEQNPREPRKWHLFTRMRWEFKIPWCDLNRHPDKGYGLIFVSLSDHTALKRSGNQLHVMKRGMSTAVKTGFVTLVASSGRRWEWLASQSVVALCYIPYVGTISWCGSFRVSGKARLFLERKCLVTRNMSLPVGSAMLISCPEIQIKWRRIQVNPVDS